MSAYFGALLIAGWAGQIFWLGFGTEHLTFYQMLLFGLALFPTGTDADSRRNGPSGGAHEPLVSPFLEGSR